MAGSKAARIIDEIEYSIVLYQLENDVPEHHDSNETSQVKFFNDVVQLKKAFEEFVNPFLDNSFDLISFDTNTLASKEQIKLVYEIRVAGKQQFKEYWNKAVANNTLAIFGTIKNNKFEIFLASKLKSHTKLHQKLKTTKSKVCLFSRLFVASQTRDGDL